jgi:hypothetical protein
MKYDRKVLERYAEQLEESADRLPAMRGLGWGFLLAAAIGVAGAFLHAQSAGYVLGGFFVGLLAGFISAQGEALRLRVQAHSILLQIQIEQNTRQEAAK